MYELDQRSAPVEFSVTCRGSSRIPLVLMSHMYMCTFTAVSVRRLSHDSLLARGLSFRAEACAFVGADRAVFAGHDRRPRVVPRFSLLIFPSRVDSLLH